MKDQLKKSISSLFKKKSRRPILIHVGKCGGSSVTKSLFDKGLDYEVQHMKRVSYDKKRKYLIVIRNPISRFVSAFNWRKRLVCDLLEQKDRFPKEKETLEKYNTVNDLAENIYDANGNLKIDLSLEENYIHHIKEDIYFHLGDFLQECKKENIIAVMSQETLSEDLSNIFQVSQVPQEKKNTDGYESNLSKRSYENLRKFCKKDYDCIDKLFELGVLSEAKYQLLKK